MPKPLSILTTVAAMSACAAFIYAQEASPAVKTPAASSSAVENKPSDYHNEPQPSTKPTPKPGASTAAPASLASPEGQPEPTPKPKKRSFFAWLFGSKRERPAATPARVPRVAPSPTPRRGAHKPSVTPAPETEQPAAPGAGTVLKPAKATPTPKSTPTPRTNERPGHGPKPVYPSETTPKPEKPAATPKPEKAPRITPAPLEPAATPPGKKTPKNKLSTPRPNSANPPAEPPADAEAEAKEKFLFEMAKSKANDDPQIKSLKAKADEATTDEESKAALRAYNKALFEKVKKIDPSLSEWADRLLAAILKRLGQ